MPTAEEKKRLLRGTIPRARKVGVDDTLRGWSWSSAPLLSPYEVPLGPWEVANAYCTSGCDIYARRVLGAERSEEAMREIRGFPGHAQENRELQLYAPEVLLMELANALRYSSEFSAREIIDALETLFERNILLIPFSLDALNAAVTISLDHDLDHDLAVYDAYFLALAQALEIPLITADRRMLSRLTAEDSALSLEAL